MNLNKILILLAIFTILSFTVSSIADIEDLITVRNKVNISVTGDVNATTFYGSIANINNLNAIDNLTSPIIYIDPALLKHRISLGCEEVINGLANLTFCYWHEFNHTAGTIGDMLIEGENINSLRIIRMSQVGKNNSGSLLTNSQFIVQNDLCQDSFFNNGTHCNATTLTNIFKIYEFYNKTPFFSADTEGYGATLLIQGGIDIFRQLRIGEGLIGTGTFDFNLKGNDAAFFGGAIHNQIPVNFTTGFNESQERNVINEGFVGILGIFVNDVNNVLDWFVTPQTHPVNLCDDEECAKAIGGVGDVIMNTTFSTLNLNDTTLNFVYSLVGLIGTDTITVETNNNSGTGWEIQLDDGGSDILNSQVIELGSDYWNASSVSIRVTCGASKPDRECYIDSVRVNGTQTITTTENQTGFDLELCAADCSRGTDNRPTRALIYSAEIDKWLINGDVNFTGVVVGGAVSGSGSINTIPKWASSTSLIDSNIIDDGSTVKISTRTTVAGDLNVTGNLNVTGTSLLGGNVGIGTSTPLYKLEIVDSSTNQLLNVSGTNYPRIDIASDSTSGGNLKLISTAGNYQMYLEGDDLRFFDGTSDRVIFLNGGNVGIGTTTPSSTLEVNGDVNLNNTLFVLNNGNVGINNSNPSKALEVFGDVQIGESDSDRSLVINGEFFVNSFEAGDIFVLRASTSIATMQLRETGAGNGVFSMRDSNNDVVFNLDTGANTNNWLDMGNFGIGTINPVQTLQIGDGSDHERVVITAGNNEQAMLNLTSGGIKSFSIVMDSSDNPDGLRFDNLGNTVMFLEDVTNDVGIGTLNPNSLLHLQDNTSVVRLRVENLQANSQSEVLLETPDQIWTLRTETNDALRIRDDTNNVNVMSLTTGSSLLSLVISPGGIKINERGDLGNDINFAVEDTSGNDFLHADSGLGFVGVGTTIPTSKLHVVGDTNISENITANQIYGFQWLHNDGGITVDLITLDVYENITTFNATTNNGFEATSDHSLITRVSGRYNIDYSVSFSGIVANEIGFSVGVNNIGANECYAHKTIETNDRIDNVGGTCILSLTADDIITLMARDEIATPPILDIDVFASQLRLARIGD